MDNLLIEAQDYIKAEDIKTLTEFLTCVISGDKPFKLQHNRFLYFWGDSNTGKSTFVKKIIKLVGESEVCYDSEMQDRKLRIFNEIEGNEAAIKNFTSSDSMHFRNVYKEGESKIPKCDVICIGNANPYKVNPDTNLVFLHKLIPIQFCNKF